MTDDNRWSQHCGSWQTPWWQPAFSVVTFCTQLDNYLMYRSTNNNLDILRETPTLRSIMMIPWLGVRSIFENFWNIFVNIWKSNPQSGLRLGVFKMMIFYRAGEMICLSARKSLRKASEKTARRSIVTGRNYYLSIKTRSKKSEVISPSTSAGGTESGSPTNCSSKNITHHHQ